MVLIIYYALVLIFVGAIGSLAIALSDEVFELENVLSEPKEMFRCIFMYQFAVYTLLKESINTVGIIILIGLTTFSVWFLNILIFALLCLFLFLKMICKLFYFLFKKRKVSDGW